MRANLTIELCFKLYFAFILIFEWDLIRLFCKIKDYFFWETESEKEIKDVRIHFVKSFQFLISVYFSNFNEFCLCWLTSVYLFHGPGRSLEFQELIKGGWMYYSVHNLLKVSQNRNGTIYKLILWINYLAVLQKVIWIFFLQYLILSMPMLCQ